MGTFLKYVFYLILLVVVFLVGKGLYNGNINNATTVGEVVEQVSDDARQMAKDTGDVVEDALEDYQSAPKKDVVLD